MFYLLHLVTTLYYKQHCVLTSMAANVESPKQPKYDEKEKNIEDKHLH